jgi:hypothetical protein
MKTRKQTIRARRVQRLKTFVETEIVSTIQEFPAHGTLELKRGELCLRQGDMLINRGDGRIEITHTWLRPGRQPFDQNIYKVKI